MKKLRILSVAILTFFAASVQSVEQPQQVDLYVLVLEAQESINLNDIMPVNDASISVKRQLEDSLAQATNEILTKRLVALQYVEGPESAE